MTIEPEWRVSMSSLWREEPELSVALEGQLNRAWARETQATTRPQCCRPGNRRYLMVVAASDAGH
jgi:hypothetical protein